MSNGERPSWCSPQPGKGGNRDRIFLQKKRFVEVQPELTQVNFHDLWKKDVKRMRPVWRGKNRAGNWGISFTPISFNG
jgi:hypothetical protein